MTAAPKAKIDAFRALHKRGAAFLFPNFWDAGSARILESIGFAALASTSAGYALTRGRRDYGVKRNDVIDHAREVCAAVSVPVAADLENGFGSSPEDCAMTIRLAAEAGLCGGSIEDTTGDANKPIHDLAVAVDRIRAAAEAAKAAPNGFVLTARADEFLYGNGALDAVIARLQAFDEAGADVLFAPGLPDIDAVRAVCANVSKPVNVLVYGEIASVSVEEFANAGVARLSLGSALSNFAYAAMAASVVSMKSAGSFDAIAADRDGAAIVKKAICGS